VDDNGSLERYYQRLPATPMPLVSEPARALAKPDGSYVMVEAPPLAEFTLAWLATVGSANVIVDEAGNLRLGEVVYQPLYFQRRGLDPFGLLELVCKRIHPPV
jgi:hypothetical protein